MSREDSSRSWAENCRQPLNVGGCQISEPQADVEFRTCTRAQPDLPDDLYPTPHGGAIRQQDVEVESAPHRVILIGVHTHPAKADVLGASPVMEERRARRTAKDLGLDARVAAPVGHGPQHKRGHNNARALFDALGFNSLAAVGSRTMRSGSGRPLPVVVYTRTRWDDADNRPHTPTSFNVAGCRSVKTAERNATPSLDG